MEEQVGPVLLLNEAESAIAELPRVLARGGAAFLEVDPAQSRTVAQLLEAALGGAVTLTRDLAGEARVVGSSRL